MLLSVLLVRTGSRRSSGGYSIANHRLYSYIFQVKGPWGSFYQFRRVLAKGRHLHQILLKALTVCSNPIMTRLVSTPLGRMLGGGGGEITPSHLLLGKLG